MNDPEADPEELARRRDDLYLKVAIATLVLLGVSLALGWILQYYFNEPLISQVSLAGSDPSWIPIGNHFGPALGVHYFGDFELVVGEAANHISPFSSANAVPAGYGPAAIIFVGILHGIFGWPGSVFAFLIAAVLAFLWGLARLLGPSLSARFLAILLLFSAGVLVCLDRGNLQILVALLCAWFAIGLLENRPVLMIVSLACALAIKFYVVVLILVLVRQKRWRDVGLVAGLTAALYAIGFAYFSGSFFANIKGFVSSNLTFAGTGGIGGANGQGPAFVLGRVSAAAAIYKPLYLFWGGPTYLSIVKHHPSWYVQVPGLVVGCVCLLIIWWAKSPLEYGLVAGLAIIQLAPAATNSYVEMNMVIELCLLLRVLTRPSNDDESVVSRRILMLCVALLVVGSAPWFGMIHGRFGSSTSLSQLLSPITSIGVVLALTIGLAQSRRRARRALKATQLQPEHDTEMAELSGASEIGGV
jgi:hypothetical protein